ncbi:hypothetical protein CEUSTIGMA_g2793.t1 [Chlamydomonas eustigma]|uniref:Ribosomal L1 domain-containing protein 1 n=1 Tax=Chlamydomonas eustigma TaxID=1157962 RepID=A0A250WXC7_9CHLO|nr:hypothetical protein CEUSTIGMA_g2793.t1 [Chlamydomonas eustigma]|eukprot:GAX75349.1 hypothetical protein CEUSTIGMA_g2793.t1 [Chlamydomonas eustigma]
MTKQVSASDVKLSGYNEAQVQKAAASLLKFLGDRRSKANDLFDDDEIINITIALKKMPLQSRKDKPIPLQLPHPLNSPEGAEICLFVKDHQGEGHKEGKLLLQQFEKNGGVTKVIGISKLKTKYESHEAKRQLCKLYDIFLADERILPSLPKLIGKSFFKKKKQPIPIRITGKDLPSQVKRACSCTYMFKNSGTCINIKVALSTFDQQQVAQNIHAVLAQAVDHIPKKWSNIRGVFIKSADSVALPLFQSLPEQGVRISADPLPAAAVDMESQPSKLKSGQKAASKRTAVKNGSIAALKPVTKKIKKSSS